MYDGLGIGPVHSKVIIELNDFRIFSGNISHNRRAVTTIIEGLYCWVGFG
jgi:hypothetical protein